VGVASPHANQSGAQFLQHWYGQLVVLVGSILSLALKAIAA